MFNPPDLSQSKQPKAYYDYDGISGGWLRFPWWFHLCIALLAWPLCWWILPVLPFQNVKITAFLYEYKIQFASAISIITLMTALFSYLKAARLGKHQQPIETKTMAPRIVKTPKVVKKTIKVAVAKAELPVKMKKISERKPKKSTVKIEMKSKRKVSNGSEQTAVPKKKRVTKKKNDEQVQLKFDE